jgi:transposase
MTITKIIYFHLCVCACLTILSRQNCQARIVPTSTMGNRKISDDLKMAALRLRARGQDNDEEISNIVGFSLSTLHRAARRFCLTGDVANHPAIGRGRPRHLLQADCQYLIALAQHNPTVFLDEYAKRLHQFRFLPVSLTTIHRSFERAGLSVKRVQKLASERDPMQRANFVLRIGQYPAEYLVFLDEVSKDDQTYARLWGRTARGMRAEKHNPFVRKRRLSMLAALALDEGIIASRVIEGSFTRESFLEYLRDDLVSSG